MPAPRTSGRVVYFAAATAIFESPANLAHLEDEEGLGMDYRVDIDPTHAVIRLTVTAAIMTPELAEDIHTRFARLAPSAGPYAAIVDLSGMTSWSISAAEIRNFAFDDPAVSGGRTHVLVARELSVFGMSRMFQLIRDFLGEQYKVVHTLEEAYDIVGVRPEDFTEHLFEKDLAA